MASTLAGKIVFVTGGGGDIGRACCVVAAREGATVVVTDINKQEAQNTVSLLKDPNQHLALHMDVCDRKSIEAAFSASLQHYNTPPCLLVNSAGILIRSFLLEADEDEYDKQMNVNMKGVFLVCQVFTRILLEKCKDVSGSIVNIASIVGKNGSPTLSLYAASKGAVIAITKTIATELASKGIRANCVLPSPIDTQMMVVMKDWEREAHQKLVPLGRVGRTEEVAEVVVFLLSPRSSYMVGNCVEITGGK